MAGKLLLGVGAAALFAFGATGAAHAADVSPIVVAPIVTPVVVVPTGPKIEITLENWLELSILPEGDPDTNDLYFNTYHSFDVKVTSARGLGFELLGNLEITLPSAVPPPFPTDEPDALTARAFLGRGNAEIGVYTTALFDNGFNGVYVGGDFTLDNDRLTLTSYIQASFPVFLGALEEFQAGANATVHLGRWLDVYAGIDVGFGGNLGGPLHLHQANTGVQLHLGPVSPYATVTRSDGATFFNVGVEFERQLGNGPFSLLAYGDARIQGGVYPEYTFGIGIKFSRGGE